ncbi:MAG TPA: hypothetical protein VFH63_01905 [candidate division Zixibacteria bacterium]|nr:hypothetical protein [candidate division Zixibacteria bacterium]
MSGADPRPIEELAGRAEEILQAALAAGAVLRLMGGVAVRLRTADLGGIDPERRKYHDIDLVGRLRDVRLADAALLGLGYEPDRAVNTQFGTTRRVYYHPDGFHVDLFFERLEFCHTIELNGRLDLVPRTTTPTDLLLQKLQIVQRNEKDLIDAYWLLLNHEAGEADPERLELDYLGRLTGADWGLHTTASDFLQHAREHLPAVGLTDAARQAVLRRLGAVEERLASAPKTMRWKARERVGRRVKWYRDVEEVL